MGVWGKGLAFEAPCPAQAPMEPPTAAVATELVWFWFLPFMFLFWFRVSCLASLAHGLAAQFDVMGVVHEAVEYAVGDGGVADLFVPLGDVNLRSQDGRSRLVAFLAYLPEVAALCFLHGRHGPVIHDQDIGTTEPRQIAQAAVGASQRQIAGQGGGSCVEHQVAVTA